MTTDLRGTLADMRRKYLHAKVIAKTFQDTPDWCITAAILERWIEAVEPVADRIDALAAKLASAEALLERLKVSMTSDMENGYPPCSADIDDIDAALAAQREGT